MLEKLRGPVGAYDALVVNEDGKAVAYDRNGNVIAGPSTDHASVIQTAVDTVGANGGGKIYIAKGRYNISSPIIIKQDYIMIEGVMGSEYSGFDGTTIYYDGIDYAIKVDASQTRISTFTMSGIHIESPNGKGILLYSEVPYVIHTYELERITIKASTVGLEIKGRPYHGIVRRISIEADGGILFSKDSSGKEPVEILFEMIDLDKTVTYSVSGTVTNSTFINIHGQAPIRIAGAHNLWIKPKVESYTGEAAFYLEQSENVVIKPVVQACNVNYGIKVTAGGASELTIIEPSNFGSTINISDIYTNTALVFAIGGNMKTCTVGSTGKCIFINRKHIHNFESIQLPFYSDCAGLPASGNFAGDARVCYDTGLAKWVLKVWDGTAWQTIG